MQTSDVSGERPSTGENHRQVSGYLPTLDGWRAVAISMVLASHAFTLDSARNGAGGLVNRLTFRLGTLGVDLFFAISGLLICGRLLEEERKNGSISLRKFYVRRSFRIMPAMMVYLAAVGVLGLTRVIHVGRAAWIASLFFFNNYYSAFRHDWSWSLYTNHLWSLAVEEHFYLLLPALLVCFPRFRVRLLSLLTGSFLLWMLIYFARMHRDPNINFNLNRSDLRIYELLFPALIAVLLQQSRFRERCRRFCNPWLTLPGAAAVCVAGYRVSLTLTQGVLVPFCFTLLIVSTVLHPETLPGRVLEWRPLRAVGRISYSLYLWQQLFFPGDRPHAAGLLGTLQHGPWDLIATCTLASLSYIAIEKPLICLGHRLAPPATPGHANLDRPAAV